MSQELRKRCDKAKADRELWRDLLEEALDYSIPERNRFSRKADGDEENFHIYDETATVGLPMFANRMQRSLTPEGQEFVKFKAGTNIAEDDRESVDKGLEEYTKVFFEFFNRSNYFTEINPSLIDCGVSTGVIQIDEEPPTSDDLYYFTNIPLDEIAFEAPVKGRLCNCWRTFEMTAEQIPRKWPKANIPEQLGKIINKDPLSKVAISIGQIKEGDKYNIHVLWDEFTLLSEVFDSMRIIAFRMNAFPRETFGRGPIILVLPAIRDLNTIQQLTIENISIQVAGMYTARMDSVFNPYTFVVSAGGVIPVTSNDSGNPTLARLPHNGDVNAGQIIIADRQEVVRKALFVEPLGDLSDPVRSATEQTMRMQEFLKDQGAGIARLRKEMVEPIVMACVDISQKRGKLPKGIKVDGKQVKVVHDTVLVQSEKQEDFQALMTWMNSLMSITPAPEMLAGMVNFEEIPMGMADMLGVPAKYAKTKAEQQEFAKNAASALEETNQPIEQGAPASGQ